VRLSPVRHGAGGSPVSDTLRAGTKTLAFDDLPARPSPAAALNLLVQERVLTGFAADLNGPRLRVTAMISARDELSVARAKRQVQQALASTFPNALVTVAPGGGEAPGQGSPSDPHPQSRG
jgi:hypothetical protein